MDLGSKHHLTVAALAGEKEGGGGGNDGGGRDRTDEIVLDIDGEQLIFSDDTFSSLPDFPCICSPSPTSAGGHQGFCSSSASSPSFSSASSAWTFSKSSSAGVTAGDGTLAPFTFEDAMVVPTTMVADADIGLDMDLLDIESMMMGEDDDNAAPAVPEDLDGGCWLFSGGGDESVSAELANIFLEWLKNNKDSISPEDLRSIKLKRSTIECAVRRLGDGKQGRLQLLKLILSWVQNSHLLKKRRSRQNHHPHQLQQQFGPLSSINHRHPNLDHYAFNAAEPNINSWIPYPEVPSAPAGSFPSTMMMMNCANHPAGGEPKYQTAAVPPLFHFPAATPTSILNNNPFSLSPPELMNTVDTTSWAPAHFSAPSPYSMLPGPTSPHPLPIQSPPPPYSTGGFNGQFPGQQVYHQQGQHFAGPAVSAASATKEARKKRMARQRRSHHSHSQQQPPFPRPIVPPPPDPSPKPSLNTPTKQILPPSPPNPPPPKPSSSPPPAPLKHQLNFQHASSTGRRQALKGDKNLKFLLQKVLKQSDVGSLGRIVLPKKEAEIHLPELDSRDGISLVMEDIGTSRVWNMRYRFWPNNKSRMYLLENTGDFVRSNGLREGDFIVIYSDIKGSKYMIRGVKVRQPLEAKKAAARCAGKQARTHQKKGTPTSSKRKTASNCNKMDECNSPSQTNKKAAP